MNSIERRVIRNQSGFSLIELLVVAAVLGMMVLMVDVFFITVNRSSKTVELAADVQQNARVAVERLSREAREAETEIADVTTPVPGMVVFPSARPVVPNDRNFCLDAPGVNPPSCSASSGSTYGPLRQAWIVYWFDNSGQPGQRCAAGTGILLRARVDATAGQPAPTSPPASGDTIATCVSSFTASKEGTDRLVVTLVLQTAGTVGGTVVPVQTVTVTSTTFMRN